MDLRCGRAGQGRAECMRFSRAAAGPILTPQMPSRLTLLVALLLSAAPQPVVDAGAAGAVSFPLRVSADQRHLEDQAGRPFMVVGDTAWSLVAQLSADDIERYLDDRARRGFNAVIVNLIEHKFASRAPANRHGVMPVPVARGLQASQSRVLRFRPPGRRARRAARGVGVAVPGVPRVGRRRRGLLQADQGRGARRASELRRVRRQTLPRSAQHRLDAGR